MEADMRLEGFEQLEVWRRAHALVLDVYRCTHGFPSDEKYGLTSQMRRAAVSVAANIAEGFKRRGTREKTRFYGYAQGSLEELRYYFILCRDLTYHREPGSQFQQIQDVGRMLTALLKATSPR
jgi:four helix bundle protein